MTFRSSFRAGARHVIGTDSYYIFGAVASTKSIENENDVCATEQACQQIIIRMDRIQT